MPQPRYRRGRCRDYGETRSASSSRTCPSIFRVYLEAYQRNAKLMLLLEQVATIDPAFRALRPLHSEALAERSARRIESLQQQGYADPGLEPTMTARALSILISRLAYYFLALEFNWDTEVLVGAVTQI
ncbi:hypothetical protein [Nocardia xishanensis]